MKFTPEMFTDLARTSRHPDAANVSAGLLNGDVEPESIEAAADWVRQCYSRPRESELVMCALNDVLDCHGVEPIRAEDAWVDNYHGDIVASYINTGDTYAETVVLDSATGEYHLTSYGDWVEALETKEAEEGEEDNE